MPVIPVTKMRGTDDIVTPAISGKGESGGREPWPTFREIGIVE
jgi:hypothetical protein